MTLNTQINMDIESAEAILFSIAVKYSSTLSLRELTAISFGVDALKTIQDMTQKG